MPYRLAVRGDKDAIKSIADKNTLDIGFVFREAVLEAIKKKWVLVAVRKEEVVGFIRFRHRRDNVFKIYEICVVKTHRNRLIGRRMIDKLKKIAKKSYSAIELKCPEGAAANIFYRKLGFRNLGTEAGRKRNLVKWRMTISTVCHT